MGFLVLLNSLVESFHVFAWTLITLVYPLYVSIRAIEGNSNSHNRKFLIYWVLYALTMLFEVTSSKLIPWIPLWSYIKLITAWWLVVPHFDGAVYAYEYIVRPCISVEPQKLVYWFKILRDEFLLHQKDDFLLLAQRYIKENGSEALEKLIIEKSMCNCMGTSCRTECNAVETIDEEAAAATPEEVTAFLPDTSSGVDKNVKVKHKEPNLNQTEHYTVPAATGKIVIELAPPAAVAAGKDGVLHPASARSSHDHPKKGQKEWTCALCLIRTTNEADLKHHYHGKKHKANQEELRAKNAANKNRNMALNMINNPDDQKPNKPTKMEPKNKAMSSTLPNDPEHVKKQQAVNKATTTGADHQWKKKNL